MKPISLDLALALQNRAAATDHRSSISNGLQRIWAG